MSDIQHITVADGVRLTVIPTKQFKKDRLSIYLLLPLKAETVAENALLCRVLTHGSAAFPDLYSLNRKLDSLYGAILSTRVSKLGEIQVLRLSLTAIKGRFTMDGKDISMECAEFLLDLLLHPVLEGESFRAADVETERRNLIDDINALVNNKSAYTAQRMVEEMCREEAYGIPESGRVEDVTAISPKSLYQTWKRLISRARMEVFAVGEMDTIAVAETVSAAFAQVDRQVDPFPTTNVPTAVKKVRRVTEEMDVEQGKLAMGFRSGLSVPADTLPLVYANAIFGSGVTSKLFLIVREKMHLCYYCYARPENFKGLLNVYVGVDVSNAKKAETAILEQLEAVKNGDFTEEDMASARATLRNGYRSVADDPGALEAWYFDSLLRGRDRSPEETAEQLSTYTKEDLVRAMSGVTLDTVFLLKGREEKGGSTR